MRVLKALSKKSITIAADFAQKIYSTTFTWKEVGVDISGNSSKSLTKSFRSTKQIVALAESLIETNRNAPDSADEYTNAVLPELDGPLPILYEFDSSFDKKTMLVERLKNLSKKDITVGIMCRTVEHVNVMTRLLRNAGISFEIIQKNREWSLLKSGIKVVKTHSSKGLEFDVVIIPNLEDNVYPYEPFNIEDDQLETVLERERKILYVAMTRARKALIMFCNLSISSRFISEFKEELYEKKYISNRNK